ncbi:hypothetical protein, partial [Vreelandella glaciei]|uniref:hypothetical protein n=1 Tax=Vreelandella glaciei TaxID=186761 RepID=UPI001C54D922
AAAQDTGLAHAAGSLRRGAQEIGRWPEHPSIALRLELETADLHSVAHFALSLRWHKTLNSVSAF